MINLSGRRFGRLLVIRFEKSRKPCASEPCGTVSVIKWHCRCDCGGKAKVISNNLMKRGGTRSCGCIQREVTRKRSLKHGHDPRSGRTPEYRSWRSMMVRCYWKNEKFWKHYGGRGIVVCKRWFSFSNFFKDMGPRPLGTFLDREDPDGNYTPSNCRWLSKAESADNKTTTIWMKFNGKRKTITAWSRSLGVTRGLLYSRFRRGWSPERILTTPNRQS